MVDPVLLNLLNELGKSDKMRGLRALYRFFATSLINSIMSDSSYHNFKTALTYIFGFYNNPIFIMHQIIKQYAALILMNRFNKIESDVFKFCRFSLFLKDPLPRLFIVNRLDITIV